MGSHAGKPGHGPRVSYFTDTIISIVRYIHIPLLVKKDPVGIQEFCHRCIPIHKAFGLLAGKSTYLPGSTDLTYAAIISIIDINVSLCAHGNTPHALPEQGDGY